ncbi:MAG: RDD family protein [Wolbachia sp.]
MITLQSIGGAVDTEMNVKVNYAEINKRVVAYVVDQILFLLFYLFILFISSDKLFTEFFNSFFDTTSMSVQVEALETLLFVVLETLMITRLGWTPGKLLCGIYIKDASTSKNIALI